MYIILVADDEVETAGVPQEFLEKKGYNVTGISGLPYRIIEVIESRNVDFIVLDMVMPGVRGIDILKDIRKAGKTSRQLYLRVQLALRNMPMACENLAFQAKAYSTNLLA